MRLSPLYLVANTTLILSIQEVRINARFAPSFLKQKVMLLNIAWRYKIQCLLATSRRLVLGLAESSKLDF